MSDHNTPAEGTVSLSAEQADLKIAALMGSDAPDGEAETAEEAEVPSHEDAETEEVHPETDTAEEELSTEDAEPEEAEVPSLSDDTEVEVNGEKIKVKDLKSGYLRQSDYTRKTQELAVARQQAESQVRAQYTDHLRTLENALIDHFPQEPNWQQLAEDNPAQYIAEKEAWNKRLTDLNGLRQVRAQQEAFAVAQRDQAIAQAQAQAYENLVQKHPEFARGADGSVSPVSVELVSFFTEEAKLPVQLLEQIDNSEIFSLLYDAMRFRRQEAQKSKTVQAVANKPPLAKPGVTQGKATSAQSDYKNGMARLKRTGNPKDAESLIKALL